LYKIATTIDGEFEVYNSENMNFIIAIFFSYLTAKEYCDFLNKVR